MNDTWHRGAVWVVWRRDRSHRSACPGEQTPNGELDNHSRALWDLVPIEDAIISTDQDA